MALDSDSDDGDNAVVTPSQEGKEKYKKSDFLARTRSQSKRRKTASDSELNEQAFNSRPSRRAKNIKTPAYVISSSDDSSYEASSSSKKNKQSKGRKSASKLVALSASQPDKIPTNYGEDLPTAIIKLKAYQAARVIQDSQTTLQSEVQEDTTRSPVDEIRANMGPYAVNLDAIRHANEVMTEISIICYSDSRILNATKFGILNKLDDLRAIMAAQEIRLAQALRVQDSIKGIEESLKNAPSRASTSPLLPTPASTSERRTYSDITRAKATIVVHPTDEERTPQQIQNQLSTIVCPKTVNVQRITRTRKGGLMIRCSDQVEATRLKEQLEANKDFQEANKIYQQNPRSAKIILFHVPAQSDAEDVKAAVSRQLRLVDPGLVRVKTQIKTKEQTNHWPVEIPAALLETALETRTFCIGFKQCPVRQFNTINRCYRCQEFGHTQHSCTSKSPRCGYCSKKHTSWECIRQDATPRCITCVHHNRKDAAADKQVPTDHPTFAKDCPRFHIYLDTQKDRDFRERLRKESQARQAATSRPKEGRPN